MKSGWLTLMALSGVFLTSEARAFERQWHVGAGVGAANPTHRGVGPGPAVGVYGAYGLSDMFDLKLSLAASDHAVKGLDARYRTYLGTLALSYKVDIIEWIPYFGVSAGLWRTDLPETISAEQQDFALGGFAGLDYAVSRSFGLGVVTRAHYLLAGEAMSDVYLRAEYRWGW